MKKFYLILAAAVGMTITSCTSNEYIGDLDSNGKEIGDGAIRFGFDMQKTTRADIMGPEAARLLGNNFYVIGTKGSEGTNNPSENIVFDNYLVHYEANTAGTKESNTANWEYVGVTPGTSPYQNYAYLTSLTPGRAEGQTIKYWDYSTEQYDFFGFSTGTYAAVSGSSTASTNIGVTEMAYGGSLAGSGTAYTLDLPSVDALKQTYVTDIITVGKANYGKEVTLKFKNLGSKVRIALYETVPGYAVKDVTFYKVDGTTAFTDGDSDPSNDENFKSTTATLISANSNGLPTNGTIQVFFPHVGSSNSTKQDYNKVAGHVTSGTSYTKYQGFGTLTNFATTKEGNEANGNYIGRTLPTATFATNANADANYYQTVFPVSSSDALTLRVDYTLVSTDGSGETINIYGAKAVVPSTYINWLPNYAYTYIFKICDNTNGWTSPDANTDGTNPGLFPITFDAVVAEATDANGEQTTITTVAAPTITTYQQNHAYTTNEYSKATGKNIYVQVMDNSAVLATLVNNLNANNSRLYSISKVTATEAEVMDALQSRTTAIGADDVTGRNGITLTRDFHISNTETSIENGPDDNPIAITAREAAMIRIVGASGVSAGTYAYVYDYTTGAKTTVTEYQPLGVTVGSPIDGTTKTYYPISTSDLSGITVTTAEEAVDNDYVYFSKTTTDGGLHYTYSYISVAGKTTVPAGVVKLAKSVIAGKTPVAGTTNAADDTFYFDVYITNNGSYAVKVIKIVA